MRMSGAQDGSVQAGAADYASGTKGASGALQFSIDHANTLFDEAGRPYTSYSIVTTYQGQSYASERRYREFRALHERLRSDVPGLPHHFPVWPNLLNRFAGDVIDERRAALAKYLTDVVAVLAGATLPALFRAFLQLPPAEDAGSGSDPIVQVTPLEASDTVILVAYHLPLKVSRAEGGGWRVEWDEESVLNREALTLGVRHMWVGCISLSVTKEEEEELSELLLDKYSCVPVFLDKELVSDYYHGFCRGYLRPIFHNQLRVPDAQNPFSEAEWRAYSTANKTFAEKVMEVYEPGYMVWVHDYHLLLLPSFILRRHRTAHIGLFLHAPFPSSELFRSIAVREELLRAMLNSDLIGFLLFEYTRNFLACCKRLLGLDHEFRRGGFLGVEYGGRHVMVQVSTFGVSPSLLEKHMAEPLNATASSELATMRQALEASQPGGVPRVLAGVDYLDRFKGVQLKLLAWENLLANYPKYRQGHVLVQIMLASRNQMKLVKDAALVRDEISGIVSRINASYPGTVYYEERPLLSLSARLLLWLQAHVVVYSAVREAVNAHPLEYVVARSLGGQPAGVAVLSEFSGFSRVLNGALVMNPFSQQALSKALDTALSMPDPEREARGRKDLEHITKNTSEEWARRFLTDLKSMERKQEDHWMAVGFGLASFRMVGMGAAFKPLDTQEVLMAVRAATRRVILLDWGGTLTPADNGIFDLREESQYEVPASVLQVLRVLCADAKNHVMIISGLGRDKVQAAFGSVPNLSLAVEHGFHYRIKSGAWQQLMPGVDTSWREIAEAVMNVYTTRTLGTYVQKKGSSITWHHLRADPEFGALQARELQYQLQGVLAASPVVVRIGKGYVEACPKGIDKGVVAERFVDIALGGPRRTTSGPPPRDFVLCLGDDSSDELMFSALHNKFGEHPTHMELFTATVGRKPSCAASYLGDHTDVVELLHMLAALNQNKNRFASTGDLASMCGLTQSGSSGSSMLKSVDALPGAGTGKLQHLKRGSKSINP